MAEDDIKSEEPTPRKLEKTREEGQYAGLKICLSRCLQLQSQ